MEAPTNATKQRILSGASVVSGSIQNSPPSVSRHNVNVVGGVKFACGAWQSGRSRTDHESPAFWLAVVDKPKMTEVQDGAAPLLPSLVPPNQPLPDCCAMDLLLIV